MNANPRDGELAEFYSIHESPQTKDSRTSATSGPCADSANRAAAGAAALIPRRAAAPLFPPSAIETKIDPMPGFLVLFAGSRVAVFAPTGEHCRWLSNALSQLELAVGQVTARKYVHAVRRFLDAAKADAALIARLQESCDTARRALSKMLTDAGCRLQHHKLRGGAILVRAPKSLVATIDVALTALSRAYDLLGDQGAITFANPIQCLDAPLSPLPDAEGRRPHRYFTLENKPRTRPSTDDPHCSALVREVSRHWPPGYQAASDLTQGCGNRISEALAVDCRDWAASDFGDWLLAPDKASNGDRVKILYLDDGRRNSLVAYFEGPRRAQTGIGLAEARWLARNDPEHPALAAPLFLNTLGRRITYSAFNDHYWRPSMRARGSKATPHMPRHEKATDGLLAIRTIARDPYEEEQMTATFAGVMGWRSGALMVRYYAASLDDADRRELLRRIDASVRERAAAPGREAKSAGAPPVPPAFTAFLAGRLP